MNSYEIAKEYITAGLAVLPLHYINNGRCSCINGECRSPGKHPQTPHGVKDASLDPDVVQRWFDGSNANVGIATGEISRIIVLDVDGQDGLDLIASGNYPIPENTPTVRTGSGGLHYYFQHIPAKNFVRKLPGLDLRADGGYVVAPPSNHKSGRNYEWLVPFSREALQPAPNWLISLISQPDPQPTKKDHDAVPQGSRNSRLTSIAGKLRRDGLDAPAILAALNQINSEKCSPPLPLSELRSIAFSVAKYPPPSLDAFPFTEVQLAAAFVSQFGDIIRYVHEWGQWLVWRGSYWEIDNNRATERLLYETIKDLIPAAFKITDETKQKAALRFLNSCENDSKINHTLNRAIAEPGISISAEDLDTHPYIVNTASISLDLLTGLPIPPDPAKLCTKRLGADYDPAADCPTWDKFLNRIFNNNQNLVSFVQRAAGYSLTADMSEMVFFVLCGAGKNGKSVLINALSYVFKDYARPAPLDALIHKRERGVPNELAFMAGSRLISCVESGEGRALDETMIKTTTGGDRIAARHLHQNLFFFQPTFKIWLATNHEPRITGSDAAIWERVRRIPFDVVIPPEDRDRDLHIKLRAEAPGILNWLIEGCLAWQKNGLGYPEEVRLSTENYKIDQDPLADFISEYCNIQPDATSPLHILYSAYRDYCAKYSTIPLALQTFSKRLVSKGFAKYKSNSQRGFKGIEVFNASPQDPWDHYSKS